MERFDIQTSFLPGTSRVVAFESREALSEAYETRVFVVVPSATEIDAKDGVGTRASLTVNGAPGGQAERHHGVVAKCELLRAGTGVSLWALTLRPEMWSLTMSVHSRVFTKTTVKAALQGVFDEAGLVEGEAFSFEAAEGAPEEHVAQYKESDHDFFHRWAERRGWYYFYEHGAERETMKIVDQPGAHVSLRTSPIPYRPGEVDNSAGEHFAAVRVAKKLVPAAIRVADYDYAKPTQPLVGKADVSQSGFGEVVFYGARAFDSGAVSDIAKFRAQALAVRERVLTMEGYAHHVRAGNKIAIAEHPRPDIDGDYLVVSVKRVGRDPVAAGDWGSLLPEVQRAGDVYAVKATCVPAALQYRSQEVTTWPRVWGHENAVVDGAGASQYAQIDSDGRYNVRFHFDEGRGKDGKASTRVRMMQPHGGSLEGWHMPLRKGTEVVCAFLDGDPDRPVIIGVVPNATNPSLVNQGNAVQNIMQTGSGSYMTIDDTDGAQSVNLFTPASQSGLYLGTPRGEGGRSVTSNAAPGVAPTGPGAKKLGPFSMDLRSDGGSGRVHSGGDLNVHALGQYQKIVQGSTNITHLATLDFDNEGPAEEDLHDTLWHHSVGPTTRDHCSTYDFDVQLNATTNFSSTWSMQTNLARTHNHHLGINLTVTADATDVCLQPRTIYLDGGYDLDVTGNLTRTITSAQELQYSSKTLKVGGTYTLNVPDGELRHTIGPSGWQKDANWIKINLGGVRENVKVKKEKMQFHIEAWAALHGEFCVISKKDVLGINGEIVGPSMELTGLEYYISPIKVETELSHNDLKGADLDLALVRIFFGSYLLHPNGFRTV